MLSLITGINPNTDAEETREPDPKDKFAALAFKIATDPFVGRLAFFRVYSGRLDAGSYVLNARTNKNERISRIIRMHANKQSPIDFIEAGDIGAAVGFKDIKTGDTFVIRITQSFLSQCHSLFRLSDLRLSQKLRLT